MTKAKVLISKIDANIHVIRAEPQEDTGNYPIARLDFDKWGNLQMWQGSPRLAHWRDEFPPCDVLVQVDIDRMSILDMLTDQEHETLLKGWPIVTKSIDPAVFGEKVAQEQASETDVLPSDCSGCPLDRAAHKSDLVSVQLTPAELGWLQVLVACAPLGNTANGAMANHIYEKLEKLSK